jgi:hypothetical protein
MSEIALQDLLADIHVLNKELVVFEHRYGLLSEAFYDWYCQGHEPVDDAWVMDLTEWAGLYKSRQRLIAHYRQVLEQQLAVDKRTISRQIQLQLQPRAA